MRFFIVVTAALVSLAGCHGSSDDAHAASAASTSPSATGNNGNTPPGSGTSVGTVKLSLKAKNK